ncbi:hypothetical protein [Luteibacter sp. 9135]|uniref:hypothetical protein n=1 Tax=Luteibacter sp. 9135 TaxID=1500893 RepID=UPI00163B03FB|nr:hypothetical protein [Luteibacter sp. 9135]
MRTVRATVLALVICAPLAGCYYDPGYGYVRSGTGGDAYYGQETTTTIVDPGYGYYDNGYGYGPGCCYSGVTVGAVWYDYGGRRYYRGRDGNYWDRSGHRGPPPGHGGPPGDRPGGWQGHRPDHDRPGGDRPGGWQGGRPGGDRPGGWQGGVPAAITPVARRAVALAVTVPVVGKAVVRPATPTARGQVTARATATPTRDRRRTDGTRTGHAASIATTTRVRPSATSGCRKARITQVGTHMMKASLPRYMRDHAQR